MKFSVVVPTLNAGLFWPKFQLAIEGQSLKPENVIVLDSQSNDGTAEAAKASGYKVVPIDRSKFDHGGTRQQALLYVSEDTEILVYLTQDAILFDKNSFLHIVNAFSNPNVGIAYGRQLPHIVAGPIEIHARKFNYPPVSDTRTFSDRSRLGLKAAFCSNSFAGYRRSALESVGGFPTPIIMAEDMIVAARMLKAGWKVSYVAEAKVYHSHSYGALEEFRRHFDTGIMHAREGWLLKEFGKPEAEGLRFLLAEFSYLRRHAPWLIPKAWINAFGKISGYRIGKLERMLPRFLKARFSGNRAFW